MMTGRKFICYLLCLSLSLTMTACSAAANTAPDAGKATEDVPPSTIVSAEAGTRLHMVSNLAGMLGKQGIASETGYYDVTFNGDGTSNITYTDYNAETKVYLNRDGSAARNTEADSSWFAGGIAYLFYDRNKLYAIEPAALFGENPHPCKIYRMEPDGSNRTVFVEIPPHQLMMRGIAADQAGNFYTVLETTSPEGTTTASLVKMDGSTGNLTGICEISPEDSLLGVWQDNFIFTRVETPNQQESQCVLYALSVDTAEETLLDQYALDSRDGFIQDDAYIYLDRDEKALYRMALESGQKTKLAADIPLKEARGASNVRGIWGDYFVIRFSTVTDGCEEQQLCGWNIKDGTMRQNHYSYNQDGTKHSAELLCACDGMYLLNCDRKAVTWQATASDGTVYQIEDYLYPSALISQTSFWNDSDDFHFIDDTTVP